MATQTHLSAVNTSDACPASATYLYDGVCVLCSRTVAFILAHERGPTIRFVALQSGEGRALCLAHGLDPADPRSFLFIEDGQALQASSAIIAFVRHLRAPWRWLGLLRVIPRPMRDAFYYMIARNRYRWFGQTDRCFPPPPGQKARFVLE